MLTIEQLNSLTDLRKKFQALTGLTWDPTKINDKDFLKKIQWYFPKGASLYKELIAFEKKVIEELGGDTSDSYYNDEKADEPSGGEQTSDEPKDEAQPGDDQKDNTQTSDEPKDNGQPGDTPKDEAQTSDEHKDSEQSGDKQTTDTQGGSEQNTPNTHDKEGNYTTVDTVQEDSEK